MFNLYIETTGPAFTEDPEAELARILRAVADRLDAGDGRPDDPAGQLELDGPKRLGSKRHPIEAANLDRVGEWKVDW